MTSTLVLPTVPALVTCESFPAAVKSISESTSYRQNVNPVEDSATYTIVNRFSETKSLEVNESTNLMHGLEDGDDFPDGGAKAWLVTLGAFFGMIADFGLMNSIGAIESYISRHQLANSPISHTSWIFSVYSFMAYFGGIYTGPLFDKYGAKLPMAVGIIFFCVGLLLTAECTKPYQFILSFSILTGIGSALLMTPLVGVSSHYFLKKRARAIAISSCGGSVGGIIAPLFLRALYPKIGFKWSIRALCLLYFACLSISLYFIDDRLSERTRRKNGTYHEEVEASPTTFIHRISHSLQSSVDFRILKNPKYLTFVIALFCSELSYILSITYFASSTIAHGQTESTSYIYLTILNATGILGRVVTAYLADKFGRFNMMIASCVVTTLAMFVLWYPFGSNQIVLYIFSVVYGFTLASIFSLAPVCCSQLVEAKHFGVAYGTAYFCISFVNLVGLGLGSLVIGKGDSKGYDNVALLASLLSATGTVLWVVSRYYVGGFKWRRC